MNTSESFNEYKKTVQQFPLKCKMYLSLLISVKQQKSYNSIPKSIRNNYLQFTSIFKNLSSEERAYMIAKMVQYAESYLQKRTIVQSPNASQIQTSCEIKSSFLKMTFWEKKNLKIDYNQQRIKLSTSKKVQFLELKYYLVRKSQSQKNCLVLQAIDPILNERLQKITVRLENQTIYQVIYQNIRELIILICYKNIQNILQEDKFLEKNQIKQLTSKQNSGITFLTRKNINNYFEEKQNLLSKLKKGRQELFSIHSDSENNITLMSSTHSSKYYYFDYELPAQFDTFYKAKESINILHYENIPNVFLCEKLQNFNQNISANYYKFMAENESFELVMIVERQQREERINQIMKSASSIYFGINVMFMSIVLEEKLSRRYVLSISAIIAKNIKSSRYQSKQTLINFFIGLLGLQKKTVYKRQADQKRSLSAVKRPRTQSPQPRDLSNFNKSIVTTPKKQSFDLHPAEDITSEEQQSHEEQMFYSIMQIQQSPQIKQLYHSLSSNIRAVETDQQCYEQPQIRNFKKLKIKNYLNSKPFQHPIDNYELKYIKQHCLLVDWKKSAKGGVICINQFAIAQQKRVVKLIFNQLGSKIFKMQGIVNFSLPVQICRPESALVSLARNLSYAPILLENVEQLSPPQRLKKVITLAISWCSLALSTQKPFNPILGQTYQGVLHGCPIYMEQISHHPPISSIYYIGRGYKIYGNISPVISVRLNYATAANESYLTIQLNNGQKIQFSISTMVVNGIIFGERSIYFEGTNYAIDARNMLIAQINFNAKSKGLFKSKESNDYLMGQIYQVTPIFMQKFLISGRKISPKKDDKSIVLESFFGQWNGSLTMNNEKIYNFQQNLPLLLQNYECPLLSDAVFRQDVVQRAKGDMIKGQQQKQRLEQLQRKDKKLRQTQAKKKDKR